MVWTLVAFGVLLLLLRKLAFPRIAENLDKRQQAIEESIETAERTKREADELLAEYRQRLTDARQQAEDIVARARKAAEVHERDSLEQARTTDWKSTRLNSSHANISYAVFCLKKKNKP